MTQYNISLFFENSIDTLAILALQKVIIPEISTWEFIEQVQLFEIVSHQEPDTKGYSLQCLISQFDENHAISLENVVCTFLTKEFSQQFVYFPSHLKLI